MMRAHTASVGLCALLLLSIPSAVTGSERVGPIEVIPLSQAVSAWRFGYIEHRISLRNLSPDRVHTIDVVLPADSLAGRGSAIERLSRRVVLHPMDTAELSMPQPARPMYGKNTARIEVQGFRPREIALPSLASAGFTPADNRLPVFVSRGVNSDHLGTALANGLGITAVASKGGRSGVTPVLTRDEAHVAAWSPNWLAYSSFAGVVLSAEEWREAPAAVREALLRYAACGGNVVLTGGGEAPPGWTLDRTELEDGVLWGVGAGSYVALANAPEQWIRDTSTQVIQRFQGTAAGWTTEADGGGLHRAYPVMERLATGAAGFFYLLAGFALLVGPLLLWLLARKGKRIWLLWIVPLASMAACIAILVYSLLSEGVTPTRRADTLAILDQVHGEGVVLGLTGYYAPLTPGRGLRFSADTALAPFENRRLFIRGGASSPNWVIDLTRDQHMVTGFVQARVPRVLQVRKPFVAANRLEVEIETGPDGGPAVVNGLGAAIHVLRVRAPDGAWLGCGPLEAGRRGKLDAVPAPATAPRAIGETITRLSGVQGWADALSTLDVETLALEPGMYVAELDACPFLERGIDGRLHNHERAILIGRYRELQR